MTDFFADLASDDLDALEASNEQALAQQGATYTETCRKCGGTGKVSFGYIHRQTGTCFACKGKGSFERKTSPEARARNRANAALRKTNTSAANWAAFLQANPTLALWMDEKSNSFEFAASLVESVRKFGQLTERQFAAAMSCYRKDQERRAAAEARKAGAPVVDTTALETYFSKVGDRAKLRFEGFAISKAPTTGRNAGALYVKAADTYLGKIQGGKFFASRDCGPETSGEIAKVIADPLAAAVAYGKRTGNCCVCGRVLTDPASVEAGIGPICAAGF